jgi:hypothetical protein
MCHFVQGGLESVDGGGGEISAEVDGMDWQAEGEASGEKFDMGPLVGVKIVFLTRERVPDIGRLSSFVKKRRMMLEMAMQVRRRECMSMENRGQGRRYY